jgi:hypothetical protein
LAVAPEAFVVQVGQDTVFVERDKGEEKVAVICERE